MQNKNRTLEINFCLLFFLLLFSIRSIIVCVGLAVHPHAVISPTGTNKALPLSILRHDLVNVVLHPLRSESLPLGVCGGDRGQVPHRHLPQPVLDTQDPSGDSSPRACLVQSNIPHQL